MTPVLNHSLLKGIAHKRPTPSALALLQHAEKRTARRPLVHPVLANTDTGDGPFIAWAGANRAEPVVQYLLQMVSGPWVTSLGENDESLLVPGAETLPDWLQECLRRALTSPAGPHAMLSPTPAGGLDRARYALGAATVENWQSVDVIDTWIAAQGAHRTTLDVLLEVEQQTDFVVLESARASARAWQRDCSAEVLHTALLGLEQYALDLARRLDDGTRPSRELAAQAYQRHTSVPMSRETGDVSRKPNRKRARTFVADGHGKQFFDMHAKPGNLTRIHVWVYVDDAVPDAAPKVFIGHCGKHLD